MIYVWALEQQLEEKRAEEVAEKPTVQSQDESTKDDSKEQLYDFHTKQVVDNRNCIPVCEGRNTFQQQDLLVPWHLKSNKNSNSSNNKSREEVSDGIKDSKGKGGEEKLFHRFYHVFRAGELKELCSQIENVTIKEIYLDCGNWCAILQKKNMSCS